MAKQKEDKFTADAFSARRPGRPPKLNAKSNAQRQREFRARKKAGFTDPVKQAKSDASDLRSMAGRLLDMSANWGEVDECFRSELERAAELLADIQGQFSEFIAGGGSFN